MGAVFLQIYVLQSLLVWAEASAAQSASAQQLLQQCMELAAAPRLAVRKQFALDSPALAQPNLLFALYNKNKAPQGSPDNTELETKLLQVMHAPVTVLLHMHFHVGGYL